MRKKIIHLLQSAKALILDFDGTLVDSNAIKRNAFEKCFADYPERFEAIMAYCKNNNHIPRQVKFRRVFENILKQPYTPKIEKQLLECYASQTTEQIIAAPEIPGARAFLEKWVLGRNSALLSSTPHDILLHILKKRRMEKYFKTARGAPVDKAQWISDFLSEQGLKPKETLFIGDSPEDSQAAKKAGVLFSLPDFKDLK